MEEKNIQEASSLFSITFDNKDYPGNARFVIFFAQKRKYSSNN